MKKIIKLALFFTIVAAGNNTFTMAPSEQQPQMMGGQPPMGGGQSGGQNMPSQEDLLSMATTFLKNLSTISADQQPQYLAGFIAHLLSQSAIGRQGYGSGQAPMMGNQQGGQPPMGGQGYGSGQAPITEQ